LLAEIDDLFQAALGLTEPWQVVRSAFDATARRLDLYLDFPKGARFACPRGTRAPARSMTPSPRPGGTWTASSTRPACTPASPGVTCPTHGTRQVALPWARQGSGFTLLFEALLVALLAQMPVKAVAELVGEHDTRLWRLLHHHVEQARAMLDLGAVSRVGVDETSARRGQDYVSLFVDLDAPKPRVVFATEGRDHSTVARFAADLVAHGGDPAQVRDVSADMSPAFEKGVRASLPRAYLTYDRYHLIAHLAKAVDEVRRAEAMARPELKGTRYAWLKRPEHLTKRQAAELAWLRSRLEPIVAFARMIGEHWEGGAALALDQDQQRPPGRDQLAGADRQAPRSGVPQQAEPDRDDLPDRRPT
jgi:hypothetical protein